MGQEGILQLTLRSHFLEVPSLPSVRYRGITCVNDTCDDTEHAYRPTEWRASQFSCVVAVTRHTSSAASSPQGT